uniref:Transmembrane protein n=1 Tax=Denticeps clupeoides TaxID=299321 RepID=A0AAY4CS51_9TELE
MEVSRRRLKHLKPARPLRRLNVDAGTWRTISYTREFLIQMAYSPMSKRRPDFLPEHPVVLENAVRFRLFVVLSVSTSMLFICANIFVLRGTMTCAD